MVEADTRCPSNALDMSWFVATGRERAEMNLYEMVKRVLQEHLEGYEDR